MSLHERVPRTDSLAKYTVAFFNQSRSIRTSATSRLSRAFSASTSVTGWRLSPTVLSRPARARCTQFASVFADIPHRRAASGSVSFSSDTHFTACSRKSAVNDGLGNLAISYRHQPLYRIDGVRFFEPTPIPPFMASTLSRRTPLEFEQQWQIAA
jgi:hypothetical protein